MKILIDSTKVVTKSGTSKQGREYKIREQQGYADFGKRFPQQITLNLQGDQEPYPAGEYTIDLEESLYVGRFGGLELSSSPVLVPITKTEAAIAARK